LPREEEGIEDRPRDFMETVESPRNYVHRRRPNWSASERIDLTETVFFTSANHTDD